MKVLATLILPPHLHASGAATAALELSLELRRHCDIELAQMDHEAGTTAIGPLSVRRVPSRLPLPLWSRLPTKFRTPLYRSELPALVAARPWDLVHIHNPMPALEMERVAAACRRLGIPYVVSTHGLVEVASGGAAYGLGAVGRLAWRALVDRPLRSVLRDARHVLALSPADLALLARYGVPDAQVSMVPNGTRLPEALPTPLECESVRREYGIPTGPPVALFVGNHTPNKGLGVLLEGLTSSQHSFSLVVAGSKRPQVNYDAWSSRCRRGQKLVFTDYVTDKGLEALFAVADLFVFPTLADTFPLVVLDAMARAVPVLSTRVGGIPHQVEPDYGVLVEPGDPVALRTAFDRLLEAPAKLQLMGSRAREAAMRRFSWERSAERAYAAYAQVLALDPSSAGSEGAGAVRSSSNAFRQQRGPRSAVHSR